MKEKILIIIPAYNEDKRIGELLKKLSAIFSLKNVLVVDDGSIDNTAIVAERSGSIVLSQKTNQGKGIALRAGFDYAIGKGYDAVITMDADGQHDPGEIPMFLKKFKTSGVDLIIGTREQNLSEMPYLRFLVNKTTSLVTSILAGVRVHDSQSGYRLIKKNLIKKISLKTGHFQMETEIIVKAAKANFSIGEMPIKTIYFKKFKSHINPFVDTLRFIRLALRMLWR
jgi:glycosyltransferase involved in cell wall biosynthesis